MMTRIHGKKDMVLRRGIASTAIDAKADEIRARFATPGKHTIYDKKLQEATAYVALIDGATPPSDLSAFPYLRSEVGLTAPTPLELAQLWIGMNQAWAQVSALIEEVSLRGKYAVNSAKDQDTINDIVAETLEELDSIGEPAPSTLRRAR
jgi:hypothetical protein